MENKQKILYVITKGNFGGAQRYVYDLATHLSKTVFDIVVVCGQGDLLKEKLKEGNIRTIEIEGLGREIDASKDFRVLRNLIKIIKEEKPDVVHFNSSKIGLLGSLAVLYFRILNLFGICPPAGGLEFRICSVFTAHGWAFNEPNRSAFSKFIFYLGHYLTILICNRTIAVSKKAKKDIDFLPFIKNKIKVVYNGISDFDPPAGGLPKEEARLILASKEANKTIIFSISELHKNKGVDVALKALALLPKEIKEKIIYSIAGDGEEKDNLNKLVKELNIENIVRFLGQVPDAKNFLFGANIFLMPSRTEAFPYAILEAGATGVPIIATSVGGIPEIIHDMQNGILVHPRNPKEIAEAISYYLDHPDKQKEFGKEIKKTITNFFSLEKMISETLKIYELKIV